jgi:quinoprotein glucose dehydrogenase
VTDRKGMLRMNSQLVGLSPGKWAFGILLVACAVGNMNATGVNKKVDTEWPVSGGSAANTHYSALSQINIGNVSKLQEVWQFDTTEGGGLETTPVIVDGVLYGFTPLLKVFALDAATGKLAWEFVPPGRLTPRKVRGLT